MSLLHLTCVGPEDNCTNNIGAQVRVSFLEVYNEEVRDLLSKQAGKALEVREHRALRVHVKGLTAIVVKSAPEMERVLEVCLALSLCFPGAQKRS